MGKGVLVAVAGNHTGVEVGVSVGGGGVGVSVGGSLVGAAQADMVNKHAHASAMRHVGQKKDFKERGFVDDTDLP